MSWFEPGTSEGGYFKVARKRSDRTCSGRSIVRLLQAAFSLHLSPIDGQMEVTIGTLVSCQECSLSLSLSLCKAVDEACRHYGVDGLSGALGQIASETNTTQFS